MFALQTAHRPWSLAALTLALALGLFAGLPAAALAQPAEAGQAAAQRAAQGDNAEQADRAGQAADATQPDRAEVAADEDQPEAAAAARPGRQGWSAMSRIAMTAVILIVPFLIGHYLSRRLRMPDHELRFSLVALAVVAGVVLTSLLWPPKLGLDLRGGAILIYEVDQEKFDMDKLVAQILKRVNPSGIKEVAVRPYGEHEVQISIPEADQSELASIQRIISQTGQLEFRIVANELYHEKEIRLARQPEFEDRRLVTDETEEGQREVIAKWVPVVSDEAAQFSGDPNYATRTNEKGELEVLVVMDPYNVTGDYLTSAKASRDEQNRPSVDFMFNDEGGRRFLRLTSTNLPDPAQPNRQRQLAIILDGYLQSAPVIRERIFDRGEITGKFTEEEVENLAAVLTAGQLPAALKKEPSSSLLTGPTLGADTIRKGVNAMLVSTVVVVIFMLAYYRFAGVVANLALLLNVLLIVAFMILFNAAFTLAGLAGLALTVGMAVDANVLIYERMREELSRGATLRMAIRNGFDRATTTIVDANVTTLISAIVLYVIGTEQVKGFAVTLILGIAMNLFTAITFSRLVFETAEKMRWLKNLRMLKILENPNFDFVGKQRIAIVFSLVLIGVGMAGVVARGKGLLDIDFTGGVSVEAVFEEPQSIAYVRGQVSHLPDVTVQDVKISDEPPGKRFLIITSKSDIEEVKADLGRVFDESGHRLASSHMSWGELTPVEAESAKEAETPQGAAGGDGAQRAPPESGDQRETPTGVRTRLKFTVRIDHDTLEEIIAEALVRTMGKDHNVYFELSHREYQTGSTRTFNQWNLRIDLPPEQARAVLDQVRERLEDTPIFPSSNKVGASVATNTQMQATFALLASLALILVYVWIRFQQVSFGLAAILALVHDVLAALGALALSYWGANYLGLGVLLVEPFKISLPVIAAFLTIIGFSLNDTIVIFDRIREVRGKSPSLTGDLVNLCVNQTLSRTILTSLTVLMVVLILYVFGGQGIHAFAFTLLVGAISGVYSTVYIATPVVIWLNKPPVPRPGERPADRRLTEPATRR